MEFAYLDESGDSGKNGSKHLVLTLLCTSKKKKLIKIIRETKKELLSKNKCSRWLNRNAGEIKFYSFPDKQILKRALKKLSKIKAHVYFMAIQKNNLPIPKHAKSTILGHLFNHIKEENSNIKPQKIIADLDFFNNKKVNRFILMNFERTKLEKNETVKTSAKIEFAHLSDEEYANIKENQSKTIIEIEHHNSRLMEELQALDLICGSIFCHIERNNTYFMENLKSDNFKISGSKIIEK